MPTVHSPVAGGAARVECPVSYVPQSRYGKAAARVIHIGAVPPPFGGVTVHVKRLLPYLAERKIPHVLYDISGTPKNAEHVECVRWRYVVIRLLREPRAVLHFHNFTASNLPVFALLGRRHATILSLHNARFADDLSRPLAPLRRFLLGMLNRMDVIIVISDAAAELLRPFLVKKVEVVVCPEFIPPRTVEADLPSEIADLRRRHQYLLAANASRLSRYREQDLYGVDLLIHLIDRLVHEHGLDAAMVFLLPQVGDEAYFNELKSRVSQAKIQDRFLFVTQPVTDACALWQVSDVVIRATNTDGNSLTVKEALWCKTPVIASDCAPRDPEVVLFRTRDATDLTAVAFHVLTNLDTYRSQLQGFKAEDNVEPLISIYQRYLRNG